MAIVVALEASSPVEELLSLAGALARPLGGRVVLVAIAEPGAAQRRRMAAAALKIHRTGVAVEDLTSAIGRRAVVTAIEERGARLLMLSPTRANGSEQEAADAAWRLGRAVAPVPTLVVRDAGPLLAWARGARQLRTFVCVDASAAGRATLSQLHQLLRVGRCDAMVTHVVDPADEHERLGLPPNIPPRGLLPEVERYVLGELHGWAEHASLLPAALELRVARARSDVAGQLVSLARDHDAELVLVGVGRTAGVKTLLRPSASKTLVARAGNVLCVPQPAVTAATPIPAFRRVLAATDLSPHGNEVVPYAYSLVAPSGDVHLIHAVFDPAEDRPLIERQLRALVPVAANAKRIDTHIEVALGIDVAASIATTAERLAVDALCLSTHLRPAIVGSLAAQLLRRCRRPVLMLPPQRHER